MYVSVDLHFIVKGVIATIYDGMLHSLKQNSNSFTISLAFYVPTHMMIENRSNCN